MRGRGVLALVGLLALFVWTGCARAPGTGLKVGVLVPLTGPFASQGQAMQQSLQLAVEELNRAGGVLGRPVELLFGDSKGTADATRSEALRLIQREKVKVLLGAYLSEETMAAAEVAAENGVLLMVPVAATNELNARVASEYDKYKYVFRTSYNIDQWAGLMGGFIADTGVGNYAFVGTNIRWNRELAQALREHLARSGIAPVYEEFYSPKEPALEPIVVALKGKDPGVVVLGDPGQQSINLVKKARDLGLNAPLFSVGGALGDERVARTLPAGGPLYFQAAAWDRTSEEARRFFSAYQEKYGYHPAGYADVLARDALFVLAQAVNKAGSLDVPRLIQTLEQGEFRAACGVYRFDRSHQARWGKGEGLEGMVVEWKDGRGEARWPRM